MTWRQRWWWWRRRLVLRCGAMAENVEPGPRAWAALAVLFPGRALGALQARLARWGVLPGDEFEDWMAGERYVVVAVKPGYVLADATTTPGLLAVRFDPAFRVPVTLRVKAWRRPHLGLRLGERSMAGWTRAAEPVSTITACPHSSSSSRRAPADRTP